jgi:hypothetical protein
MSSCLPSLRSNAGFCSIFAIRFRIEVDDLEPLRLFRNRIGCACSMGRVRTRSVYSNPFSKTRFLDNRGRDIRNYHQPLLVLLAGVLEVEKIADVAERKPLIKTRKQGPDAIRRIRSDTYVGMAFSNLVGLAIMVTTAATLQKAG